jgi:hypothetical protein
MQGGVDYKILKRAVEQLLVDRGLEEDALLANPDAKCSVSSCTNIKNCPHVSDIIQ